MYPGEWKQITYQNYNLILKELEEAGIVELEHELDRYMGMSPICEGKPSKFVIHAITGSGREVLCQWRTKRDHGATTPYTNSTSYICRNFESF